MLFWPARTGVLCSPAAKRRLVNTDGKSPGAAPCVAGHLLSALLALAAPVPRHDIRVYSEFIRVDPYGAVVRADRSGTPREILSPAIARNAFSGFQVIVSGNPGESFALHVGQNPEEAVRIAVYRETYVRWNDEWIPDGLRQVDLPYTGTLGSEIPGQTAQAFWMDLWASADAPVRRIKVEPDVFLDGRWIRYPMEIRVVQAAIPAAPKTAQIVLPAVSAPSDASAQAALRAVVCGQAHPNSGAKPVSPSVRSLIARDARQDFAIAGQPERIWEYMLIANRARWCSGYVPDPSGPESFLRIRDRIYRAAEH